MKIIIDMNLPPSWVEFLAEKGFEAVHWSKISEYSKSPNLTLKSLVPYSL